MRSAERLWSHRDQPADGGVEEALQVLAILLAEEQGVRGEGRVGAQRADPAEAEQQPHAACGAAVGVREAGERVGGADGAGDRRVRAQPELDASGDGLRVLARRDEDDVVFEHAGQAVGPERATRGLHGVRRRGDRVQHDHAQLAGELDAVARRFALQARRVTLRCGQQAGDEVLHRLVRRDGHAFAREQDERDHDRRALHRADLRSRQRLGAPQHEPALAAGRRDPRVPARHVDGAADLTRVLERAAQLRIEGGRLLIGPAERAQAVVDHQDVPVELAGHDLGEVVELSAGGEQRAQPLVHLGRGLDLRVGAALALERLSALLEEPRVLHRDRGEGGERVQQRDLLRCVGPRIAVGDEEHADDLVIGQQRHAEQ